MISISTALDDFNTNIDIKKEEDNESSEDLMGKMIIGPISTAPGWDYNRIVEYPVISTE